MQNPVLIEEYRGGLLENIHPGRICVVGPDREVLFSAGDTAAPLYYRSSSKPLQALAPLLDGLDEKYGLTVRETALLCGSHAGEPVHVETLLSMLEKIGAKEEDLLMLPTYPANQDAFREAIRLGLPPRKAWHNCSGKHAGAMMLQKEAAGSVDRVSTILDLCDITVLSGDDALTLPMISVGAKGIISVTSNIVPGEMSAMVKAALAGDFATALQYHRKYYPFFRDQFIETNPIPIKAAMAMVGLMAEEYRLPLCELSPEHREKLAATMKRCGIL